MTVPHLWSHPSIWNRFTELGWHPAVLARTLRGEAAAIEAPEAMMMAPAITRENTRLLNDVRMFNRFIGRLRPVVELDAANHSPSGRYDAGRPRSTALSLNPGVRLRVLSPSQGGPGTMAGLGQTSRRPAATGQDPAQPRPLIPP